MLWMQQGIWESLKTSLLRLYALTPPLRSILICTILWTRSNMHCNHARSNVQLHRRRTFYLVVGDPPPPGRDVNSNHISRSRARPLGEGASSVCCTSVSRSQRALGGPKTLLPDKRGVASLNALLIRYVANMMSQMILAYRVTKGGFVSPEML